MATITGKCLCGAVRYATEAEPVRTLLCHCTTCQRANGSAFAALMAFPAGTIAVTGTLKTYTEPGGHTGLPFHRRFCPDCGTPVILEREGGERTLITAGTLDDTSVFTPQINLFCESARPWVAIPAEAENLARYYP